MSKELPYFRFTASQWLNDDISLEEYPVKGLFADICAYYWFKDCSITKAMLYKRYSNAKALLKHLFSNGIIKTINGSEFIEIKFLNEQFDLLSEARKRRQNAGAKGGKKRSSNAIAMLKQSSSYKDKDKDKDMYIVPPTIEMIIQYCKERNNIIDPYTFFDWNNSKGWMIGKNKMKDWQAAIRTWEKREEKNKSENVKVEFGNEKFDFENPK